MGKKRKHEENGDEDLWNKRVKHESDDQDGTINGLNNVSIDGSEKFKVFLIKKPIGVSLEDLRALRWSNDNEVLAKSKIKTESGSFRAVVAPKSKKERMVYVPAFREKEEEDAKNIKARSFVEGAITILPQEVKHKHLGGSIYEEGEEPIPETAEVHPGLKKIKKTAVLELDSRKQRNKAYGTTTESNGNPRKLINLLRK
ncbi:unnamed protein product [Caenorhabditis sp. 36 PRJEB53466]|nr:unnamed protein product [Caenorhabditis sp. 36 PRJEB53466]